MALHMLENETVRLEPLTLDHAPLLATAAAGERSSFALTWVPDGEAEAVRYVEFALAQQDAGNAEPYAVVAVGSDQVVGSTRLWDFVRFEADAQWPQALELGFTWYSPPGPADGFEHRDETPAALPRIRGLVSPAGQVEDGRT